MSTTQTEITRLTTARDTIRNKLSALGLADASDKLDALASAIDAIQTQTKTVTPTSSQQTVTPDSGYNFLTSVTVGAVVEKATWYQGTDDPDASLGSDGDLYLQIVE
jgi:hypothetical protein